MLRHPLTFTPVLVAKPWGGDRLATFGRAVSMGDRIGESWDVADLTTDQTAVDDPVSRVATGHTSGRSLSDLIVEDRAALMGRASTTATGRFPLLVKLLDARETLSVQVHPPRELAPDEHKTESWIVLAAEPGATLWLGVEPGTGLDRVLEATGTAELLTLLRKVSVEVGDVVHLPAGTIHALGAGVIVAEVQTTSDATYRVWDWPQQRGGGRELHVAHARGAIAAGWQHNHDVAVDRAHDGVLVDDEAYVLRRTSLAAGEALLPPGGDAPVVVVVTGGVLRWADDGGPRRLTVGGVALLPATCSTAVSAGEDGAVVVTAVPT